MVYGFAARRRNSPLYCSAAGEVVCDAILAKLRFETCASPTLPPTERLRAAALLSVPHSPVEVISPFFVAPRERKQIELRIGEMALILGDGHQLGRQLPVMIRVQIGSRLICLL